MEYLNPEYLKNDDTEYQWNESCKMLMQRQALCEDKIQPKLLKIIKDDFFHDAEILEIILKNNNCRYTLIVVLKYHEKIGQLIHSDVQKYTSLMNELKSKFNIFGGYLYGEIFIGDDGLWHHNFLLNNIDEINIVCKKIKWVSPIKGSDSNL